MTTVTLELDVMILESKKIRVTLKSSLFSDRLSSMMVISRHCVKFVSVMLTNNGANGAMKSIPPPADQENKQGTNLFIHVSGSKYVSLIAGL